MSSGKTVIKHFLACQLRAGDRLMGTGSETMEVTQATIKGQEVWITLDNANVYRVAWNAKARVLIDEY